MSGPATGPQTTAPAITAMTQRLSVAGVTKAFGATLALDDVSLLVEPGSVHALLGSNGSGKSTLVKLLAGVHQATSGGLITVGDRTVASTAVTPADSRTLGLRFVHQQLGLFPQLSIADNFAAAAGYEASPFATIDRKALRHRTSDLLRQFRIEADPDDRVAGLRPSMQTLVAIGRAMADRETAKVLVLDEPTESLAEDETQRLLASIKALAADGMTFVIVSHRLAEVAEVADHATVLRDGRVVASAPLQELSRAALVEHITGRRESTPLVAVDRAVTSGRPTLAVEGLSVGSVRDLSFEVGAGEVLGIAGLVGSGRSAVLEGIFGARPVTAGSVSLHGVEKHFRHPGDAVSAGVALVPEDRAGQGLFPEQQLSWNMSAASLKGYRRRFGIDKRREQSRSATRMADFGIKASSSTATISTLSGGNQQKAILARWLDTRPSLLLLDEPTQGVDIGARAEIHAIIREAVGDGMSVVLVSSDLEELCQVSDRVLVLNRGRLERTVTGDLSVARVSALMHQVVSDT